MLVFMGTKQLYLKKHIDFRNLKFWMHILKLKRRETHQMIEKSIHYEEI